MNHTPSIGLLLTFGVLAAGQAFGVEYQKLKTKIDKDRAGWQAQPSPFTAEERKFKITAGAVDEDETRTAPRAAVAELENGESSADLPAHFDWRNRGGLNYMPQSPHQGSCGSCVSFASMAAVEAQLNIACDAPDRSFDMSRQFFFSCGGGSCKNGWKLSAAMSFLETSGVPDTSCMPYTATDGKDVLCSNACADHKERAISDIKTEQVTSGFIDRDAIKKALLKGPLIANMILYEDLEFYKDGIYRHVDGMKLGTHAIVLAGWDNSDQSWIAMNSWGPTWGQNGFFMVAWDDVSLPGRYTWGINVTRPLQAGICNYPR
jgi:C1A family cysteine protease